MIFLTKEILENTDKLNYLIKEEQKFINYNIKTQQKLKEILLNYAQNFAKSTAYLYCIGVDNAIKLLKNLQNSFSLSNTNILALEKISKDFDSLLVNAITNESEFIDNFNKTYSEAKLLLMENTIKIEECLCSISNIKFPESTNSGIIQETLEPNTSQENIKKYTENTLIISEMSGKVILPYTLSLLEDKLQKNTNKYKNYDDIIHKDYSLPINLFKTPSIARFREAFKLMKNKEKSSIKAAFDLGMELLFNYNLHPAIITACKNLDELDIYLDYLETGETDKFDCFNIVFEIAPKIVK